MPIKDDAATWLDTLRTVDREVHAAVAADVEEREIGALLARVADLRSQTVALRGAIRVRDRLLEDQRIAVLERDRRVADLERQVDELAAHPLRRVARQLTDRALVLPRRAVALPRRLGRAAVRATRR
ncbi:hypothetical protein [Cellulomonas dongxiuzhuiae]|uniref:Uncharacterized protein n=1 Tax=Cellulomonas dongxiuzhuiae TaxID=2819979 RepID=A0ABX8GGJ0_9CELL|nr:hypothetical protein [Cellulomonas dongxiuzhuiae]MBO3093944.1 hypothetical protein [Cellulomonas dongxiuzhuiae]QWC15025.1 hypothetical protein KKR89_11850 [Cellulomonas dongxiuzhuiae]